MKYKVGDRVITNRFDGVEVGGLSKLHFNYRMAKFVGKESVIGRVSEKTGSYLVHNWWWPEDSLTPTEIKYRDREDTDLAQSINKLVDTCYGASKAAGWHDNPREIGTMLMLIVSEVAEAMEGDRKGLMDDHLPHRTMIAAELADATIRIADLAGKLNIPLGDVIIEKLEFNKNRLDHKPENRGKEGGKKY